jgi:hypothetical protein
MSRFVEECQKEWNRLAVPQAIANEMAADLEADLAEAEADGVSPEEVLGNGYFDARAFAGEWARARGVIDPNGITRAPVRFTRLRPLTLALATVTLVFGAMAALGLLMLVGEHSSSVSLAVVAVRHAVAQPAPGFFLRPGRFGQSGPGAPFAAVGLLLLVSGLVGAGVSLWFWKARTTRPDRSELERSIGMPTYF